MPQRRPNPAAFFLLALAGVAALLKASRAMSRLSDALQNLNTAVSAAATTITSLREENAGLREQLVTAQSNSATDDEVAQLQADADQLNGLVNQQTPETPPQA